MARNYLHTIFTGTTRALQAQDGSRDGYARMEAAPADQNADAIDVLTPRETAFITARDSFYIASVTADGWPYIQHRGGPPGFLQPVAPNRLAFADYRGNRQFVSMANIADDPRVALFLVDYPNRRRLKLLGRASVVTAAEDAALVARAMPAGYDARPERVFLIDVIGFDWNCPQHITPRFTEAEIAAEITAATAPLHAELAQLRAEIDRLRAATRKDPRP